MGRIYRRKPQTSEKRQRLINARVMIFLLLIISAAITSVFIFNTSAYDNGLAATVNDEFNKSSAERNGDTIDDNAEPDINDGEEEVDNDKSVKPSDKSSSVVIEQSTKKIISGVNHDARLPMASTTKIVTAILACRSGRLDEIVTIPAAACGIEGSSIYLTPNEKIKLEDLVYGLMLRSGNDAAAAIALHLGGSIENFVAMMNDYAKSVGAVKSNFANPHGLHDPNHYTTAYDLALITADALNDAKFDEIVSTKMHTVKSEGKETRYLANKNKMLTMYDGAIGVKTGYTKVAGRCLVSAAEKNGLKIISVVLNEPDMWAKSVKNLDEGFRRTKRITLIEADKEIFKIKLNKSDKIIGLCVKNNITDVCIDKTNDICYNFTIDKKLKKNVSVGDKIGVLQLTDGGKIVNVIDLYAKSVESCDK